MFVNERCQLIARAEFQGLFLSLYNESSNPPQKANDIDFGKKTQKDILSAKGEVCLFYVEECDIMDLSLLQIKWNFAGRDVEDGKY